MTDSERQLVDLMLDAELPDAEGASLLEQLEQDPEALAWLTDRSLLHADLRQSLKRRKLQEWSLASAVPETHDGRVDAGSFGRFRTVMWWAAAAVPMAAFFVWQPFRPESVLPQITPLATLVFAEDCLWQRSTTIAEGERLGPGRFALESGFAVVRMDGGAEIGLLGETELELLSAAEARLSRGDVTVRATDGAEGFRLLTPASEMTDLGTEFAVRVEPSGATELHVLDGEVAYAPNAKTEGTVLSAGKAVRFDRTTVAPHPVTVDAPRFDELVKQANPRQRPDLMTVYEGFHYDAGVYEPGDITKGKGWAGPWRLRERTELRNPNEQDSTTDMRIVHGKINVPWPVEGGRLGGLEMPAGKTYRVREMRDGIDMKREGITYFSLMTQEPGHSLRGAETGPLEGVRLTFRSSADYWGEALSFGIGGKLRPVVNNGLGVWTYSAASISDEQSLLWIGKIVSHAEGDDEISFRIYGQADPLDYAEPLVWHVQSRGLRLDAELDLVLLTSHGTSPRIVDELRIGPTWRSVVPIHPKPMPSDR